jgi:hypothetical protein
VLVAEIAKPRLEPLFLEPPTPRSPHTRGSR